MGNQGRASGEALEEKLKRWLAPDYGTVIHFTLGAPENVNFTRFALDAGKFPDLVGKLDDLLNEFDDRGVSRIANHPPVGAT